MHSLSTNPMGTLELCKFQQAEKHQPRAAYSHAVVTPSHGWTLLRRVRAGLYRCWRQLFASCTPKEKWGSFIQHSYEENILGPNPGVPEVDGDILFGVKRLQNGPFRSHMEGRQELKTLKKQCGFWLWILFFKRENMDDNFSSVTLF